MSNDQLLVTGLVLCLLSIPSLIAAVSDGRPPRVGGIFIMSGLVLVAMAVTRQPGGYAFAELPGVVFRVIGQMVN